jgi:hypothetical protein
MLQDEYNNLNTSGKEKGMPTALGILELSPTSILIKLEAAYLLNPDCTPRNKLNFQTLSIFCVSVAGTIVLV